MDLFSYLLGKQSGGGGGGNLQEKTVTITEDGTTVLTPDAGYDGFSKVTINTETGTLPKIYQAVEWIAPQSSVQNDGQYINTGVNVTSELKIEINLRTLVPDAKGLYGGGIGWENKSIQGEADNISYFEFENQTTHVSHTWGTFTDLSFVQDKNVFSINEIVQYTFNYIPFETDVPLTLLAINRNGVVGEYGTYMLYKCRIYDAGVLIRELIPCYRKEDGEIGMFDTINKVFYTNAGTGTFSKGNDVN